MHLMRLGTSPYPSGLYRTSIDIARRTSHRNSTGCASRTSPMCISGFPTMPPECTQRDALALALVRCRCLCHVYNVQMPVARAYAGCMNSTMQVCRGDCAHKAVAPHSLALAVCFALIGVVCDPWICALCSCEVTIVLGGSDSTNVVVKMRIGFPSLYPKMAPPSFAVGGLPGLNCRVWAWHNVLAGGRQTGIAFAAWS